MSRFQLSWTWACKCSNWTVYVIRKRLVKLLCCTNIKPWEQIGRILDLLANHCPQLTYGTQFLRCSSRLLDLFNYSKKWLINTKRWCSGCLWPHDLTTKLVNNASWLSFYDLRRFKKIAFQLINQLFALGKFYNCFNTFFFSRRCNFIISTLIQSISGFLCIHEVLLNSSNCSKSSLSWL